MSVKSVSVTFHCDTCGIDEDVTNTGEKDLTIAEAKQWLIKHEAWKVRGKHLECMSCTYGRTGIKPKRG
jgi:hypothetical protein